MAEHVVEAAKKQNRQAILDLIQRKCDEINDQIEALGHLHHDTPPPVTPRFDPPQFREPPPLRPAARSMGFFDKLIPGRARKVAAENAVAEEAYLEADARWQASREAFARVNAERRKLIEEGIYLDIEAMERYLEENLAAIVWPRETLVRLDIGEAGNSVALDVDLPEVEDMPKRLSACVVVALALCLLLEPPLLESRSRE